MITCLEVVDRDFYGRSSVRIPKVPDLVGVVGVSRGVAGRLDGHVGVGVADLGHVDVGGWTRGAVV